MTTQSETPQVDALAFDWHPEDGKTFCVSGEFVFAKDARQLEREVTALTAQLAEARRDAERFTWWVSADRSSNSEIVGLLVRQISGDRPTVDEWRQTIDAAMKEPK